MNLGMLLDMAVDGFGDRVVVGRRESGLTARRLQELADAGARGASARHSDALLYVAVNGPAFPVALFAAARAGIPLVPLNYRLGAEQLEALVSNHPDAVAIADPGPAHALLKSHGHAVWTPEEWLAWCSAQALTRAAEQEWPETSEDAVAAIIYTSGTTSTPKGVVLRHHNLVSYVLGSVEFANAEELQAALVSVPPYHIAAVANVITNLFAGRRSMVLEQFRQEEWIRLVSEQGITHAMVVPTMLARILDTPDRVPLPSLRTLSYGGAPMPLALIERALRSWPDVDFVNAYGLTETSSTLSVLGPDDHREAFGSSLPEVRARLSSVGQVLPGVELEIRDEHDQQVPAGVPGRIWVRGPQVSAEYSGRGPAVDARGFFDTRDEGVLDEAGYLFIGGRTDDTIIRGGENIAPAEIEEVLMRHPDVSDAVVLGVPDDEWGQRLEAAVVPVAGTAPQEGELQAFVRSTLRGSKTPERIVMWTDLPRTETGKLLRRQALERLALERQPAMD
jgi:acyl-CoA synthetase (AMP-forming)/AMP-acid ligase II